MHETEKPERAPSFIETRIAADKAAGKYDGRVHLRFPPEPNGYLHIGHAKAICVNFGLAQKFDGLCNLRFDDTNPSKEEQEYIDSIKTDVSWLGFNWHEERYASDYFPKLYDFAVALIEKGKAYVDDLSAEQIRAHRGTLTEPGKDSPHRTRSVEENLDLFRRMREGEFEDGSHVLRAKIDMASGNINMRDPVLYRIMRAHHARTGDDWCIYPMYDHAHGQGDSIEGITHSLCTLEFEAHRPLYEWLQEEIGIYRSEQIEFARLEITYTMLSKRKLIELVRDGVVDGWDDPRMPTLSGLRRRGYTPEAIRAFCETIGLAKTNSTVDKSQLEFCVREDLNKHSPRFMGVLNPLKVVITNWPEGKVDELDAVNNPEDESAGKRKVPFSGEFYIEREDFHENPPKKYFRLGPEREVRLRYGYFVKYQEHVKNDAGEVTEVRCTYDPETRGGNAPPDGRKVRGTIHWVSAQHAVDVEARLYDHLFATPDPNKVPEGGSWRDNLNPNSLERITAKVEPALAQVQPGDRVQFERRGYFCADIVDSKPGAPVFNRTVTLRDSWAKIEKRGK